jgi:hypothetical protein
MVKTKAISRLNTQNIFSFKMTLKSQKDYNNGIIISTSVASKGMKRVRGMPRLHPLDPATALGLASNLVIHLKQ